MDHCQGGDDYVLGRDISDSIRYGDSSWPKQYREKLILHRLDAQHLLWKLHNRYTLHPAIPKSDHMKIAEVGTGTGYVHSEVAEFQLRWRTS